MTKSNIIKFRPAQQALIADSFVNFAASMGIGGKDKRLDSTFVDRGRMPWHELEALYREDWIGGKIVDIIPDDMTRNWRTFSDASLTPEERTKITAEERRLKLKHHINFNKKWSRLYGGSLIVMNIDDGLDPSEPLIVENIKPGQLRNLIVFDRRHADPHRINTFDPLAENFRQPETYRLANTSGEIHHTRVVRMDGQPLPYYSFQRNNYWGDPVFKRIRDAIVNANIALDSAAGLLFESNVDVVGVDGLLHMLATDEGTAQLTKRFQTAKFLKANNNITVYDKGLEEVKNVVKSFAGIPELLDRFLTILSAASDTPATRLFGKSPVGLNATGDGDLRNYYDSISGKQESELRPPLETIDVVMAMNLGIDPEKMEFSFNPLWQIPDTEAATVKLQNAQADQIYLDLGVVNESMIAQEAKDMGTYGTINDEWIEELAQAQEEADRLAKEGLNDESENTPDDEEDDDENKDPDAGNEDDEDEED